MVGITGDTAAQGPRPGRVVISCTQRLETDGIFASFQVVAEGLTPRKELGLSGNHGMTEAVEGVQSGSPNMAAGPGSLALSLGAPGHRARRTPASWRGPRRGPRRRQGQRAGHRDGAPTWGAAAGSHREHGSQLGQLAAAPPPGRPPCTRDCEMGTEGGLENTSGMRVPGPVLQGGPSVPPGCMFCAFRVSSSASRLPLGLSLPTATRIWGTSLHLTWDMRL